MHHAKKKDLCSQTSSVKIKKNIIYRISSNTEMETRNKLVAQPTKCGSFQNSWSFSQFLGVILICSTNISTTRKGTLNRDSEAQRPSLTLTQLSGALSCITCPEDTVQKASSTSVTLQLCDLMDRNTVSYNKYSINFFCPWDNFLNFLCTQNHLLQSSLLKRSDLNKTYHLTE